MLTIKNIQFTKLLKGESGLREFNFRKTANGGQTVFNIDVTDDRSNRIFFSMQKQDDVWKIQSQQLPSWITKNETSLHEVIEQELQA
jgi:hypothetical protein